MQYWALESLVFLIGIVGPLLALFLLSSQLFSLIAGAPYVPLSRKLIKKVLTSLLRFPTGLNRIQKSPKELLRLIVGKELKIKDQKRFLIKKKGIIFLLNPPAQISRPIGYSLFTGK